MTQKPGPDFNISSGLTYTCKYPRTRENALYPLPGKRSRHQAHQRSPKRLAQPHPQGNSAVIDIKQ
uniref:Uncharacterized protein n=1 Tax=Anguilla anguilla TaxID=7936 RepID=A0A0E9WUV3_ANGAN